VDWAVGVLLDVTRDGPDQEPTDAAAAVRADDDARRALRTSGLDDAGRRVALPDEDMRMDALRADPLHDRRRVMLARSASLIDPLPKAASGQAQPARVDDVNDDERDLSLESHLDGDPFRGEGNGAEVGRKYDRSMWPGRGSTDKGPGSALGRWASDRNDGNRHAPIVVAHHTRRMCQMARASGPVVTNGGRGVG
jgi:hypothetical protein